MPAIRVFGLICRSYEEAAKLLNQLVRDFCYDSGIEFTKRNVLNLLSASKYLEFTEDVAPENLHGRCQRFMEMESNNGVQRIMTMPSHSQNDSITDYEFLFTKLAAHALVLPRPRLQLRRRDNRAPLEPYEAQTRVCKRNSLKEKLRCFNSLKQKISAE